MKLRFCCPNVKFSADSESVFIFGLSPLLRDNRDFSKKNEVAISFFKPDFPKVQFSADSESVFIFDLTALVSEIFAIFRKKNKVAISSFKHEFLNVKFSDDSESVFLKN